MTDDISEEAIEAAAIVLHELHAFQGDVGTSCTLCRGRAKRALLAARTASRANPEDEHWWTGLCSAHRTPSPLCETCNPVIAELQAQIRRTASSASAAYLIEKNDGEGWYAAAIVEDLEDFPSDGTARATPLPFRSRGLSASIGEPRALLEAIVNERCRDSEDRDHGACCDAFARARQYLANNPNPAKDEE
jgi:bacterioferritin-associated ferredoxin